MALLPWVWYGGESILPIKALLRTGTDDSDYQYWVGGDRPVPFGPLPVFNTAIPGSVPQTIMSTGPGLDDWVVCYHNNGGLNNTGPNIAFANAMGIFRTRDIPMENGSNESVVGHGSKGIMCHHPVRPDDGQITGYRWTSVDSQETEVAPTAGGLFQAFPTFVLPNVLFIPFNFSTGRLGVGVAIDPTLSHALHSTAGSSQTKTLISANGNTVQLSPELNTPGGFTLRLSALVNRNLLFTPTFNQTGAELTSNVVDLSINRWQINLDGTWAALPDVAAAYQNNADHFRLDSSIWLPSE